MKQTGLMFCLLVVLFFNVSGQEEEQTHNVLRAPLFFTEVNAEHPVGIFSLDLPFYFHEPAKSSHRLSFGYSMGNVWAPKAWFIYPKNMTEEQRRTTRQFFFTERPGYFSGEGIDTEEKTYAADGVLNHFRVTWLGQWKKKNSLIVNMNLHFLTGGKSPVNYLVSDQFIEWFHTSYAVNDNYGRRLYPFNRALIEFAGEDGYYLRIEKGDVFTGVFDMHYYRELLRLRTPSANFDVQAAAHLSVPVNKFHPYIIPGVSAGARSDVRTGRRTSFTFALDVGVTDQTFIKAGRGIKAIDWKYRKQASAYIGFNIMSKRKNITSIGVLNTYKDPLMKGADFNSRQTGYKEMGVRFLQGGDYWEEEFISQEFWLPHIGAASLYYYTARSIFILGLHKKDRQFNFYVAEDFISYDNASDFQIGFQYSFSLPFKRRK